MSSAPGNVAALIEFPPFQLDLRAGQLRRGTTSLPLRPKTFGVLQHLAERPGELVTKQALLDAVWGDVAVTEDVVRLSVGELRAALGDERAAPRFIETVPRRGYRFIARQDSATMSSEPAAPTIGDFAAADGVIVGRERERATIAGWLSAAASGRRQLGFITGEAGIGKTTLVDQFIRGLGITGGDPNPSTPNSLTPYLVARGQCVEHHGGGEPYMPLVEALDSLCRGIHGEKIKTSLCEHAPAWLLRVLGLTPPRVGAAETSGNHEHTLHRLAACLDALASESLLVLVIEDVQWSDYSTLDLLSVLIHRREPARMLVLCTLRPADAIAHAHPVTSAKRELLRKGLCQEIALDGLSAAAVARYLSARFKSAQIPEDLLSLLLERSEGNPFFLVALVDYLLEQRMLVEREAGWHLADARGQLRTVVPDGLRAMIESRLERLAIDERRALETASVAGQEFAAHAIARVAPSEGDLADVEYVEQLCDGLARRYEILRGAGESVWPDGTTSGGFAFRHALYQQVIYQGLSPSTRRRLHQMIGEALEAAHAGRTEDVASELASHFERSRDVDRAVRYHGEAAAQAKSRFAYRETQLHLAAALGLMSNQPETPERLRREISYLHDLGVALFAMKGYGDESGARAYARMRELTERLDGDFSLFQALEGQLIVHTMRAELAAARVLGAELIALAERLQSPTAVANANVLLSATLFNLAEVETARHHAARGRALFDHRAAPLPNDVGVQSCILGASTCGYLGLIGQARSLNREALERADLLDTPFHHALATNLAAGVCMLLDDVADARSLADEAIQLADTYGFAVFRLMATMVRGWCDAEQGRIEEGLRALQGAFQEYRASGQRFGTTSYSMIVVRSHLLAGDVSGAVEGAEAALAFAAETGERVYEPEFHRLKGECILANGVSRGNKSEAIEHFQRALTIAAERQGLLFELRAAVSLSRLQKSTRPHLARLVERFGSDDDCVDLRAARAVLAH